MRKYQFSIKTGPQNLFYLLYCYTNTRYKTRIKGVVKYQYQNKY